MSAPRLEFTEVRVRRMPGFPDSGFAIGDLCDGINVIHGPNASGKSTVARSIQALLWPSASDPRHTSLLGQLELEGKAWRIDLDAGHVRCQVDGTDSAPPAIAPAETRDRYYLSLQDLLALDDGRDLAAVVLRESSGGYDLAEAGSTAGFKARPGAPRRDLLDLRRARADVRRARDAQNALRDREAYLDTLESRRADAVEARTRIDAVEVALRHHEAGRLREEAVRERRAFPEAMAKLTGRELEELARIRKRRRFGWRTELRWPR